MKLSKFFSEAKQSNSCTQTEYSDMIMNLEDRLMEVDSKYRTKIQGERLIPMQNFEEKLFKAKKDLEQRLRVEMNSEVNKLIFFIKFIF